jgi:hypothetical protein
VRDWDALWDAEPRFRRIWRVSTVIWGLALLADAVIRVVMAYTLPVDVVPGLGGALYPVTFVLIQIVTNVYYQVAGLNRLLGARWLAGRDSARQHVRVERAGRVERGAEPGEQAPLGG